MVVFIFILAALGLAINTYPIAAAQECLNLTTLTYHHIQPPKDITETGEEYLTVNPDIFSQQLQQLSDRGYEFISMEKLSEALDQNYPLPSKSILLTFDDGYEDLYYYLFPIIRAKKIPINIFLITGLMNVPGYLTWDQAREMSKSGLVYFGNHTWSHAYKNERESYEKEIEISERQLWEKNFNRLGAFAYPYGSYSPLKEEVLSRAGIKLAFTTKKGSKICPSKYLEIPRISMGPGDPKEYGL